MKFGWTLESLPMVIELIDQVLALHPDIEWFHIGGDEVMCLRNEIHFQPNLIHCCFPLSAKPTGE